MEGAVPDPFGADRPSQQLLSGPGARRAAEGDPCVLRVEPERRRRPLGEAGPRGCRAGISAAVSRISRIFQVVSMQP